jgi:hypothetical protein
LTTEETTEVNTRNTASPGRERKTYIHHLGICAVQNLDLMTFTTAREDANLSQAEPTAWLNQNGNLGT